MYNSNFSLNVSIRESRFKILHRRYLTLLKIAKMSPGGDDKCWRCMVKQGTYIHMWWFCPVIMLFCDFKTTPLEKYSEVTANLLAAAAPLIAQQWKSEKVPLVSGCLSKIWHVFCYGNQHQRWLVFMRENYELWSADENSGLCFFQGRQGTDTSIRGQILELL